MIALTAGQLRPLRFDNLKRAADKLQLMGQVAAQQAELSAARRTGAAAQAYVVTAHLQGYPAVAGNDPGQNVCFKYGVSPQFVLWRRQNSEWRPLRQLYWDYERRTLTTQ